MTWLLALTLSLSAQAEEPVYVTAGATVTAKVPSYLLPEPMFDHLLIDSRTLSEAVTPGLHQCESICGAALKSAKSGLVKCEIQLTTDSTRIAELLGQSATLQADLIKAKNQRNIAWGIVGSLVAGSAVTAWTISRVP